MRKFFFLAVAVVACAKQEAPPADTAAPAAPPPPAALTPADLAGTWTGTSKQEGVDSARAIAFGSSSDSTGWLTFTGTKDTVKFTTKFDADSSTATSATYKDPTMGKNPPDVFFRSVARKQGDKLVGSATIRLASKPDSVLGSATWEGTKNP